MWGHADSLGVRAYAAALTVGLIFWFLFHLRDVKESRKNKSRNFCIFAILNKIVSEGAERMEEMVLCFCNIFGFWILIRYRMEDV